jgi:hypothetical protein
MPLIPPENSIAWAQFALRGGWRKTIPLLLGYVGIVGTAIILSIQFNPKYRGDVCLGWTTALLAIQSALLVIYGCSRLTAAIRQDNTSRMMESHRLMPTPPSHAIAGYIVGGTSQGIFLALATFLIGVFTAAGAGISFERWAMANIVLLTFAMFLWCIATFAGFLPKGAGGIIWLIISIPVFGEGGAMNILPGLTVLLSPLIGPSIFQFRASWSVPWTYAMALAAQAFFGGVCFIGAMRKYQRVDAPGLGVLLSLAMLVGWAGVSWAGIREWNEFRPGWLRMHINTQVQIVASIIAGVLIAIAPTSAVALDTIRWKRHVALRDPAPMRRPLPWPIVILLSTILVIAITCAPLIRSWDQPRAVVRTAIVVASSLLGIYFLCRWCYRASVGARFAISFWIFLTWILPMLLDVLRFALSTDENAVALSSISACGPLGALVLIWTDDPAKADVGIMIQLGIVMTPLALDIMTRPRRLPAPPLVPQVPSV